MRTIVLAVATVIIFGMSSVAMASGGAAIYKSKCSACHGQNAQGTPGMAPSIAGTDFIKGDAGPIVDAIVNGRAGAAKTYKNFPMAMPKLGISEADAKAITDYLKSL
ncbi:MAG: c-type cytochrome [Deltaproteobacteria bacterium]|nr:c-type cytochrome [Deltaproteobacteria bacterium]